MIDDSRHRLTARIIENPYTSLLDIGCGRRVQLMRKYLSPSIKWQGLDFPQESNNDPMDLGSEILIHDLNNGIPYPDNSFDVVIALQVLEHLDNPYFILKEMIRVARNDVVVGMPNQLYWVFRWRALRGEIPSSGYRFPPKPVFNRHKWFPTLLQTKAFIEYNAKPFKTDFHYCLNFWGKYHKYLWWFERLFYRLSPVLFVYSLACHIDLKSYDRNTKSKS